MRQSSAPKPAAPSAPESASRQPVPEARHGIAASPLSLERAPVRRGTISNLQRTAGNRAVQRLLSKAPTGGVVIQRLSAAARTKKIEVKAHEIWEKKGSPSNQTKEQQDEDWKAAEKFVDTNERAHDIWEDKGSPKNQSEEDQKKDWAKAEAQLSVMAKLKAAGDAKAVTEVLDWAKKQSMTWDAIKYGIQNVRPIADFIRGDQGLLTATLSFCTSTAEKAEAIAILRGAIEWKLEQLTALGVTGDEYLDACVRVKIFEPGVTAEDNKTHTEAKDADEIIQEKLGAMVLEAAKAGRKIAGQLMVVGMDDWHIAGMAHYGYDTWITGGKYDAINGFVDGSGRVIINKDEGNAGTTIHEGLHKYSQGAYLTTMKFQLNEGCTEYFTRKICVDLKPPIVRGNYQPNYELTVKLKDIVGEALLSSAYFDGAVEAMKTKFVAERSLVKWNALIAAGANWVAAEAAVTA